MYGKLTASFEVMANALGCSFVNQDAGLEKYLETVRQDITGRRISFVSRKKYEVLVTDYENNTASYSITQGTGGGPVFTALVTQTYVTNTELNPYQFIDYTPGRTEEDFIITMQQLTATTIGFGYYDDKNVPCSMSIACIPGFPELWVATIIHNLMASPADRTVNSYGHPDIINALNALNAQDQKINFVPLVLEPLKNADKEFRAELGSRDISKLLKSAFNEQNQVNIEKLQEINKRTVAGQNIDNRDEKLAILENIAELLKKDKTRFDNAKQKLIHKIANIIARAKEDLVYFEKTDLHTLEEIQLAVTQKEYAKTSMICDYWQYIDLYQKNPTAPTSGDAIVQILGATLLADSSSRVLNTVLDWPENREIALKIINTLETWDKLASLKNIADKLKTQQADEAKQTLIRKIEEVIAQAKPDLVYFEKTALYTIEQIQLAVSEREYAKGSLICDYWQYISLYHKNPTTQTSSRNIIQTLGAILLADSSAAQKKASQVLKGVLERPENKEVANKVALHLKKLYQTCYKIPQYNFACHIVDKIDAALRWSCFMNDPAQRDLATLGNKIRAARQIRNEDIASLDPLMSESVKLELAEYIKQANAVNTARKAGLKTYSREDATGNYQRKIQAVRNALQETSGTRTNPDIIRTDNTHSAIKVLQGIGILLLACTIIPVIWFIVKACD